MTPESNVPTTYNGVRLTTVSVKPDGDSTTSKKITVRTTFDNVPIDTIVTDAIRTDNIRYQRDLRKLFDTLTDGATMERVYGAKTSATVITPEMAENAFRAKLDNMTPTDRVAYIEQMYIDAQTTVDALNEETETSE